MGHSDTTPKGEIGARPAPAPVCDAVGVWETIRGEAAAEAGASPFAQDVLAETVLRHPTLRAGLAALLAGRLHARGDEPVRLEAVLADAFSGRDESGGGGPLRGACLDLAAAVKRDRAHPHPLHVFLFYKGYLALQTHRCAHRLWGQGRRLEALWLQARSSETFGVDIHPRAVFGAGIVIDHATGVVVGETAVVEDDVALFHDVTLGATGKHDGDRHPKIRRGALVGAGAQILGNVEIGQGARVGAGSVVVADVPAYATAVGVPARVVEHPDRRTIPATPHASVPQPATAAPAGAWPPCCIPRPSLAAPTRRGRG